MKTMPTPTTTEARRLSESVHIADEIKCMDAANFAAAKRAAYQNGRAEYIAGTIKQGVDAGYYKLAMDKKTRTATISDSFQVMATAQGTLKADGKAGPITAECHLEERFAAEFAAGFELFLDIRVATNRAIEARLAEADQ